MRRTVLIQKIPAAGFFGLLLMSVFVAQAQAASISYYLDQSNSLPDGVNYAQVTISDSTTTAGDIDFTVDIIASAFSVSGSNFGMQTFSFNYDTSLAVDPVPANIINLDPASWSISQNANTGGGFGRFEFEFMGTGSQRTETLTFTITGLSDDTVQSYAVGSTLFPSSGEFFAAHIAGFDTTNGVTSAKFAGSTPAVPVPAAVWLFGSGLLGLVAVGRRHKSV